KTSVAVIVAIVLVVMTTVTFIILGAVSYHRHTQRDLEYVRTSLAVDADQIGPSLARPIRNSDRLAINQVVEGMMLDRVLKGVIVKSADDKTVLCARERDGQGKVTETNDVPPVEGALVEKRDVQFENQHLATVTLFGTTKPVQDRKGIILAWILYNILWVNAVLFLGTALLFRFYVFKPLREIKAFAALSCLGKKPPPLRHFHGELESVRLSTEQMLAQLDARNSEVKAEMGERKRAEEGLREKQAQLFLAMDIAKLGYWEFDVEKNVLTGDEKLFQLLGTTSTQEGGLSMSPEDYIRKFVHPSDAAIVANEVALGASAKDPNVARQFEHRFIRKDGTEGVMMVVRSRIIVDSAGRPGKIFGTCQDITERKKLEQQFLRSQRMESLGVLAGGVAHDLNNSLAPILMAVSLMDLQFTDPESQKLIDIVELSARRGVDMVRQLLSFARGVEGRKMELQVGHLIREIEKLTNDTFLKDIQVETDVADNVCPVVGDPTQIQQVLLNLCVNARDAMPDGGRIYISAENVTLDRKHIDTNPDAKPGPYVLLKVTDTGTGIRPGIIDKIFDPFFTTKEIGKGTGLGLSTSLAIIKSHGGFIQVHSKMKQGTSFEIYLPAKTDLSRSRDAEIDAELQRGNGELVMIVDDEAEVREIMQQSLEMFGYRAIVASGGDEAAMIFATRHSEIDVVITDMMMPVMNGPVTIQVLRTINPTVRIIATSGLSAKEQADRLGVKHFLMKPYTTEILLMELKLILAESAVVA
ncbi:MAG TPA: ATP-binding protein, partial [Chthoniobacterales bacterium]